MKKIVIVLFIISLLTRFIFLVKGMPSLTHDEADFYYSGYTLAKTGSDQYNNKLFLTTGYLSAVPAFPIYISALFWKIAPVKNIFYARLPFALLNSFTPVFVFLIIFFLSKNTLLALVTFFILNFSPWFLHLSATAAFDSPIALMFSLLSTFILIRGSNRLSTYVLYIISTFIAFNSYMGFKTLFFFFILWQQILWYVVQKREINCMAIFKSTLISLLLFLVFLGFVYTAPQSGLFSGRASNDIVFFNKGIVENEIWYARLTTNGSSRMKQLFANKVFTPIYLFFSKYIRSFDPNLFFVGEPHVIYGLRVLGLFYMTDLLFFIIGLLTFGKNLNFQSKIILLILLLGGIPFAISAQGTTVALRGYFLIVPYSLLIALGYIYLVKINKHFLKLFIVVLSINVCSFFIIYQTRITVLSSESWHLTDKIVIEKIQKFNKRVDVYAEESKEFFLLYSFYSKINPEIAKKQLINPQVMTYRDKNRYFHRNCDELLNNKNSDRLILINPKKCSSEYQKGKFAIINSYMGHDMTGQVMYYLLKPSSI